MANIAVITGVSRGLGASTAKLFLETGVDVIGVSRTKNKQLAEIAEKNNQLYQHYVCDLSNITQLEETIEEMHEVIQKLENEHKIEKLFLINNAGVVHPINQAKNIENNDLISHVTINTIAPMILTNQFLKRQPNHQIPIIVANVSSGAAERETYGWSAYCSTKASINMYTKTVALEQEELGTDNKVIAFSPGIMDTDMQGEIRTSDAEEFSDIERFKGYKESNLLRQTDIVAGVLIDIIHDEDVKNGKIYSITNYI